MLIKYYKGRAVPLRVTALILCLAMLSIGCAHTEATRSVADDGTVTLTLNRMDSEMCIAGDSLKTENASWFDRIFKIPRLFDVQVGPGATPTP